jgi:SnoaL-like domain
MNDVERLCAIEEIKRLKARYFRGVDTSDAALVRSILADDCVLDYRGCCTDPATGRDFLPAMNVVLRGSASWSSDGLSKAGIVSVHHGHDVDIELTGDTTARATWSMTDRLFIPTGAPFSRMTGYGYYHETYERIDGTWKIKTLEITRIRVEET